MNFDNQCVASKLGGACKVEPLSPCLTPRRPSGLRGRSPWSRESERFLKK